MHLVPRTLRRWLDTRLASAHALPLGRNELDDLVRRYRRVWHLRYQRALHVLTWTTPGTAWAADFAQARSSSTASSPTSSRCATGQRPATAVAAAAHPDGRRLSLRAESLFLLWGAPLVLKADNGGFIADQTCEFVLAAA